MEFQKVQKEIFNPVNENVKRLAEVFPSVVKDGQVDFEALKAELGQFEDVNDTISEQYGLGWSGREEAKRISNTDIVGRTLKYIAEDSKNADTTENLYIEGDNLEILKLLRNSYYNKIKMIYIDPPYNTGNDFVYNDTFAIDENNAAKLEGDMGEDGERYIINQKTNSRYHANWLSMMYPRLKVAKDLLKDDGVIFISIDDNEVDNLKKICNEIFYENNFEGHIHWRRRHNQPNDKTKMIGLVAEHILCYSKNHEKFKKSGVGKVDLTGDFSNTDNDPRGDWASKPWKVGSDQSGSRYTIISPTGKEFEEEWMGDEETYKSLLLDNRIIFPKGGDGTPRKKYFRFEREEEGQCATNWWSHSEFGHNQGANDLMTSLFGQKNLFSNPKPIELIRGLIQISNAKDNDIILDFFSGSSTTAHAVMNMDAEDKRMNLKYIMVQIEEDLPISLIKADSNSKKVIQNCIDFLNSINKPLMLTEIGKERIRRAGEKIKDDNKDKEGIENLDIGFKVFRTADTNIRWFSEAIKSDNITIDEGMMSDKDRLDFNPGYTDIDVVYEILLRHRDIPLSTNVEKLSSIGERTYIFADTVVVCLEKDVTESSIDKIAAIEPMPTKVIFRDSAFGDDITLKTNSMLRLEAQMKKNSGIEKKAYRVEFI